MQPFPPVSSPPNISQQSKTRRELTGPSPNPAPPTEMRQKVVEILASTANGCLQELGYYPGMPARLQELEARNRNWQSENVKLYEDNKRLVETMKAQDENLRLLNAPETERIKRITNLESENRALKMQLEQIMKIKSNADPISTGQDQTYARLHKEFMNLTEVYNRAYHEIVQLREIIRGGQVMNPPQQRQDQTAHPFQQQTLRNAQNSRQALPLGAPSIPMQAQTGPIPNQHMFPSRTLTDINLAGQQQIRRNEIEMQQNQRQYSQLPAPNPSSRRIPGNMINSMNPPIQIQPLYPHLSNQQVHGQPSIIPIANLPPQYQYVTAMQHNSRPNQVPNMGAISNANVRRAPNAILPPGPSPTSQNFQSTHLHTFSNNLPAPTMRVGSAPLPTQNPGLQLPPHLAAINRSILSNNPHPSQLLPNLEIQTMRPQSSGQHASISPNETLASLPPSLIAPTPTFATNVAAMISQPTQFSPSNTPTIRQSPHGYESVNVPVSIPPNLYHSDNGTPISNSASPIPYPRTMNLKRENMSVDSDLSNEFHKKPRLESPVIDQNTPPPPSPSVPPSTTGRDISTEPIIPETNPIPGPEQPAEEDDEEEIVEVGPDGLRLVEDILEQVYGEDRRGEVVCWFCKHRYEKEYTYIPPTPFIGATDQELEQHCINEHLDAWNQARADV